MARELGFFVSGLIFAVGLGLSGMTQPSKVQAFLDLSGDWDPSLLWVLGSAVLTHTILYRVIRKRSSPLWDTTWHVPTRRDISLSLIFGSLLFGMGWGLMGYCPGPLLVNLSTFEPEILVFGAAMLVGIWLHQWRESFVRKKTKKDEGLFLK